jgi:hypothetical protein
MPWQKREPFSRLATDTRSFDENATFTTHSAPILLLRTGNARHRIYPRIASLRGEQSQQQRFAVEPVRFRAAPSPRSRHRCRINNVALDALRHETPMVPASCMEIYG